MLAKTIDMSKEHLSLVAGMALLVPLAALAQGTARDSSSLLVSFFWSVVPIILVAFFVWWFFKRALRNNKKRTDDYIARQTQHMERVELLLERIAKVVEQKDTNGD